MGQVASVEAAQRYVERDFSSRLLLSHGLFHSPIPAGSYVICEVDSTGEVLPKPRNEAGTELVVQVIVLDEEAIDSTHRRSDEELLKGRKHAASNGCVGVGEVDLVEQSDSIVVEKCEVQDKEESSSAWVEENWQASFTGLMVQKLVSKLAPAVSIAPASFDQLMQDIEKFQDQDDQISTARTLEENTVNMAPAMAIRDYTPLDKILKSGDIRHPNVVPLLGAYKGEDVLYLFFPPAPCTLESILHFSPSALGSEDHIRLSLFEILSGLAYCHSLGVIHGNLRPWNVLIRDPTWSWLTGFGNSTVQALAAEEEVPLFSERNITNIRVETLDLAGVTSPCQFETSNSVGGRLVDYKGSNLLAEARLSHTLDWRRVFKRWWAGEISNFDYLLLLNKLSGRRWGDRCFHTVMPWVVDFSLKPHTGSSGGWRDLTKSKWRLAKGDEQLDFTYASAELPHHVSDECLSELAVCIYKARRLPLLVLRRIVRSVYEPNEYPASMQRLYQWTPDECIPEFYSDADVFKSIHPGMSNLAVPPWSHSAEEFISLHRAALESDRVSQQLHHWIDLTFGYKLSGQAAIDAKNVTLLSSGPTEPRCTGRRQLFSVPHPRRREQHLVSRGVSHSVVKKQASVRELDSTCALGAGKKISEQEHAGGTGNALGGVPINRVGGTLQQASDHFRRVAPLEELVESTFFCESARHLSPCYLPLSIKARQLPHDAAEEISTQDSSDLYQNSPSRAPSLGLPNNGEDSSWDVAALCEAHSLADIRSGDVYRLSETLRLAESKNDRNLEDLVRWEALRRLERPCSHAEGGDVFAAACIIAEVYIRKPLFDPVSMANFEASGILPENLEQLPPFVLALVKPALHRDFQQRPSAKLLLKSPFFSNRIRAVFSFLAPLHSLPGRNDRLLYASTMAKFGAFRNLGSVATEMVAPYCLSTVLSCASFDPTAVMCVLRELLRVLKPHASKHLLVPVIQQILQGQDVPMQFALLQPLFLREVQKIVGTGAYLEHLHFLVMASLRRSSDGSVEVAAAAVLISMCQDLGLPITLHQTLTPLILSFGRDMTLSGIDVLVGIGERLGAMVMVKHILPSVRSIISVGLELGFHDRMGPSQTLRILAMVDAMAVLDRIIAFLPASTVISEFLQDPHNVYAQILLQPKLRLNLLQCAAKALLLVCQHVGPEITTTLVLPQLHPLFEEVAYEHEDTLKKNSESQRKRMSNSSSHEGSQGLLEVEKVLNSTDSTNLRIEEKAHSTIMDRAAIVNILYPGLASLLGIEKLRQCLTTWLLLEQALLKHFKWKWGGLSTVQFNASEVLTPNLETSSNHASDCNPANLLLDGVGWSIPQSQAQKWKKSVRFGHISSESSPDRLRAGDLEASETFGESWDWVPGKADSMGALESFGRGGLGLTKDEQPWELNSLILHSWRVHSGAMRATAVMDDENAVFTAGAGSRGGSVVRQWKLENSERCKEYTGHQEAVVDICLLPGNRVASCDGTLHIWSAQTGDQLAVFDEAANVTPSTVITNLMSSSIEGVRQPTNSRNSLGGLTASLTGGHLYTCLHSMEVEERLVAGTVNGSLRFFDIVEGRRLFIWRCEPGESSMSSYVSALSSSGRRAGHDVSSKSTLPSAWVAVGFNSGQCRLLDYRSGRVVVNWRAHDASITKLDVLDENYLVSSSLDKSLCLWDLRRGLPTQLQTFRGHSDGVASFALRGTDVLSAAGNKIGLSSLSKSPQSGQGKQVIQPQKLYTAQRGTRSFSQIVTINVLPFSRFFLLGTEEGFLKVCS